MNYKLIDNSLNNIYAVKETVLRNRGIDDWKGYIDLTADCTHDFSDLDNIDIAATLFLDTVKNNKTIGVIVD